MFKNYLKQIGLENLIPYIGEVKLNKIVEKTFTAKFPTLSDDEVKKLYVYDVPKMSLDGSCSIIEEKADKPYNLANTFSLTSDFTRLNEYEQTIRLWRLNKIVHEIFRLSGVNWFGIYRKIKKMNLDSRLRGNDKGESGNDNDANYVLVKEAYEGLFSRAEFPLTKEFAKKSNNSTVGLTGKAIVIQDVAAYTGAYYKCDGKVNSEFCAPILNTKHEVIGIIDAEAFAANHYSSERLLQIAKVAYDLGQVELGV